MLFLNEPSFRICLTIQWFCAYLLPLPQILQSSPYVCLGFFPNQFFPIYSAILLVALPLFVHLVLFISMVIFEFGHMNNTEVYPAIEVNLTHASDRSLVNSICLMAVTFALFGYGPRSILGIVDLRFEQSIVLYSGLEILPSLTLLIGMGYFYLINVEIRKNIPAIFKC